VYNTEYGAASTANDNSDVGELVIATGEVGLEVGAVEGSKVGPMVPMVDGASVLSAPRVNSN
jgi:hypothetical protein